MNKKSATKPTTDLQALRRANEIIEFRFQMAFPELTRCFAWLSGGLTAGATFQSLVDGYTRELRQQHAVRLLKEIDHLREMSVAAPFHLALDIMVAVLGWDFAQSRDEAPNAPELLTQLEEVIRAVWEVAPA